MEITHNIISGMLTLRISGHITGVQEVNEIKSIVEANKSADTIKLDILDAFVIPSALIGYLMKLVNVDEKIISIAAYQEELYQLLSDLQLEKIFQLSRG